MEPVDINTESLFSNEDMDSMNQTFSLDTLDDWQTMGDLTQKAKSVIESTLQGCKSHIFIFSSETQEYREMDKEGLSSIQEDSLFIGCLTMQDELMNIKELFEENQLEDPMLETLFHEGYEAQWVIPVKHHFRLLAFILISPGNEEMNLDEDSCQFLDKFLQRLRINIYAAYVADNRQRNLLSLAEFPRSLQRYKSVDEILNSILDEIYINIPFDQAVLYLFDDYHKNLIPKSWRGFTQAPGDLGIHLGISGYSFSSKRALAVADRQKHATFSEKKGEDFIRGSFVTAPIYTDKRQFGVITLSRNPERTHHPFGTEQRYMMEIIASFTAAELDSRLIYDELENSYLKTVSSLNRALEARDIYTLGHSERVMHISMGIGTELGLSHSSLRNLHYAAILHDIGKVGIKDSIITKKDKLSEDEYMQIKEHTQIGYEILDSHGMWGEIRELIRYHHEKMDGSGYYGKKLGDYPWEVMIISLADIYDALTSERPYRKPFQKEKALEAIEKLVGTHFDQSIYDAFLSYLYSEYTENV